MKRKRILVIGIIVVLITVMVLSISGCQRNPISISTDSTEEQLKTEITELKQKSEDKDEEIKGMQKKHQRIDSLLASEEMQKILFADGRVKEIVVNDSNFIIYDPWIYFHTGNRLHRSRSGYLLEYSEGSWYVYPTSQTEYDVED